MIKICLEAWDKYSGELEAWYRSLSVEDLNSLSYKGITTKVFGMVSRYMEEDGKVVIDKLDLYNIVEIDNGDYQGTLLYLVPFDTYQPNEHEYLMTYIGYGSCSCCDTLQGLELCGDYTENEYENTIKGHMTLARDILSHIIRPYNTGWRNDERFDTVTLNKEENEND